MTTPDSAKPVPLAKSHPSPVRPHRWERRVAILIILATLGWVCRAPLLRIVPMMLITGERDPPLPNVWIIVDGAESYDEVARRMALTPSARIWLFARTPNRLQRRGLLPPTLECSRLACESAGIKATRMEEQSAILSGTRGLLDEVDRQLASNPNIQVGFVINEWNSRWLAGQIRSRVSDPSRRRTQIIPVTDAAINRSTWWHTKPGRRRVAEAVLKLVADWIIPDRETPPDEISDEALRRAAVGPL
ncbi:MAG: hypothetical protein Q8K78_06060 [Planctomycetaceae bacterium]|nr:hypothetical protein [Planctomycetaceae bacterium]